MIRFVFRACRMSTTTPTSTSSAWPTLLTSSLGGSTRRAAPGESDTHGNWEKPEIKPESFLLIRREEDYQEFVNSYWSRDMDHSCQDFAFDPGHNVSDPWELCGMLSKSLPFVESDLFIMVSLRDSVISRYRARKYR